MKTIYAIALFALGGGVGVLATQNYFKTKYETIANEEIESVKDAYAVAKEKHDGSCDISAEIDDLRKAEPKVNDSIAFNRDVASFEKAKVALQHYNYSNAEELKEEPLVITPDKVGETMIFDDDVENFDPYVISPDELGDKEYTVTSLIYYADGILADDYDNIIDDIPDTVGEECLSSFGVYEDDCVYVRNARLEMDYEICKENRTYEEVVGKK